MLSNKAFSENQVHTSGIAGENAYLENKFISESNRIVEMKALRSEGYSNADIAKKLGMSYNAVLRRIGYQPTRTTKANHKIGCTVYQEKRALKSESRKDYQSKAKLISEYNQKVNQLLAQAKELTEILSKLPKDLDVQPLEVKL